MPTIAPAVRPPSSLAGCDGGGDGEAEGGGEGEAEGGGGGGGGGCGGEGGENGAMSLHGQKRLKLSVDGRDSASPHSNVPPFAPKL